MLSSVIDSTLGRRCSNIIGYQYSEIVRSLMSVYFCGGSCVEDVTSHLMRHLSCHPTLRTCSSDTILRAIKELTQDNVSYASGQGKTYDFNTADKLNTLLVNALISTGELSEDEGYDVDLNSIPFSWKSGKESAIDLSFRGRDAPMETLTYGKENTPTAAFLPMTTSHRQGILSNSTTCAAARSVYSII